MPLDYDVCTMCDEQEDCEQDVSKIIDCTNDAFLAFMQKVCLMFVLPLDTPEDKLLERMDAHIHNNDVNFHIPDPCSHCVHSSITRVESDCSVYKEKKHWGDKKCPEYEDWNKEK